MKEKDVRDAVRIFHSVASQFIGSVKKGHKPNSQLKALSVVLSKYGAEEGENDKDDDWFEQKFYFVSRKKPYSLSFSAEGDDTAIDLSINNDIHFSIQTWDGDDSYLAALQPQEYRASQILNGRQGAFGETGFAFGGEAGLCYMRAQVPDGSYSQALKDELIKRFKVYFCEFAGNGKSAKQANLDLVDADYFIDFGSLLGIVAKKPSQQTDVDEILKYHHLNWLENINNALASERQRKKKEFVSNFILVASTIIVLAVMIGLAV